jgi:hypothetical protein
LHEGAICVSDTEKAQISWIRQKLGVDIDDIRRRGGKVGKAIDETGKQAEVREVLGYGDQATELRQQGDELGVRKSSAEELGSEGTEEQQRLEGYKALGVVKDDVRGLVPALVAKSAVAHMRLALTPLLQKCKNAIDRSPEPAKTKLATRLNNLCGTHQDTTDETSKVELDKLEKAARSLLEDALKAGRGRNGEPIAKDRNLAYAEMIGARYGVTVTVARGNEKYLLESDLAKMYDALSMVPTEHIMTSSLTKIEIRRVVGNRADYDKDAKSIGIDTVKIKKRPTYEYKVGNKTFKVATLNVATLHEVGHAVDDKASVMANPGGDDCGGWEVDVPIGTVADAYLATIAPNPEERHKPELLAQITKALQGTAWERPEGVPQNVWKAAERVLSLCKELANDKKPWLNPRPAGTVAYHKTYSKWYGYKMSARKVTQVGDYQWRAPVEWFVELYAATWLTKAKPPAGVNGDAARFMFRGKS